MFEGFLPRTGAARTDRLTSLAAEERTIVLFESPRRLTRTLRDLLGALGDRRVAMVRELTKLHQEVLRGSLSGVLEDIEGRGPLKGEVVVVIEGSGTEPGAAASLEAAVRMAAELAAEGLRKREAARRAAAATGHPSTEIYARLVASSAASSGGPADLPSEGAVTGH